MRIISGKYKGRVLKGYTLKGTRPTMDRVKESLFATINEYINNSVCLDLFAGSGNLGIEALSMGAREVVFVDKEYMASKTIKSNIDMLDSNINATILTMDYLKALEKLYPKKFDLIFLDPPYKTDYINKSLKKIEELNLCKETSLLILESDELEKIEYSNYYEEVKTKKYGDKYIRILKKRVCKEICVNEISP